MRLIALAALALALTGCVEQNTHADPDSAVMEPSRDGSHWVTPAGTRVYLLYTGNMVCAVGESRHARHGRVSPAVSCVAAKESR